MVLNRPHLNHEQAEITICQHATPCYRQMTHDRGHNDRERGCAHANEHEDERRALLLLRRRSKRANGVNIAQARKKELEETIQFCS